MSQEARDYLVSKLFFQADSDREDLLNPEITQTQLIALLLDLINKGFHIEVTAVKTRHSDDSYLGYHCHFNGFCADVWPLDGPNPGNYLDAENPYFQLFLSAAAASPWLYQIGLVGDSADSPKNFAAAGPTAFKDKGGPHVHLGAKG